ncbi:MAG TPA: DNA mismatch repair endonuclease MutL [bacterium]|nr:DNA mismatch repair endonuclease MutL [bacterium]
MAAAATNRAIGRPAGAGRPDRAPIRVLPPEVAARIAAGEVVERPASVVRELVDNAIDAGATEVRVELRGGGLELIRVADNGCGIPPEEVELAFRRHATSKLRSEADLRDLASLGFRGEALPSIAAVAEVVMVTRVADRPGGVMVELRGGILLRRAAAARQPGTTVSVRHLFHNVPARLKFLPAGRTESAVVGQLVRRVALAHPGVRLALILDGHLSFNSTGSGSLEQAVADVYGASVLEVMRPIQATGPSIAIRGLLGGRTATRPTRSHVTVVVNGRPVANPALLAALEDAYRPFLPRGRHPIAVIALEVPRSEVDPNVHPSKTEVRLAQQERVAALLADAVREALRSLPSRLETAADLTAIGEQPRLGLRASRRRDRSARESLPQRNGVDAAALPISHLQVIAQLQGALILAHGPGGLYLVDQHRAHERVIFERLLERAGARRAEAQSLLEPLVVELPRHRADRVDERLPELAGLGFVVERFGERQFLVRALPAAASLDHAADLSGLLDEAAAAGESWRERLLISVACRSAVRRNQPLAMDQMEALLRDLARTISPAACPHGSPLVLHISESLLHRQFGW